uniref:Uncharacterized protein n=1 Tax=Lepeophtheirus salmonis TaxID=72036 RepID=A0A0K2TBT3_LEPSM
MEEKKKKLNISYCVLSFRGVCLSPSYLLTSWHLLIAIIPSSSLTYIL